jgi:hypothetical protein
MPPTTIRQVPCVEEPEETVVEVPHSDRDRRLDEFREEVVKVQQERRRQLNNPAEKPEDDKPA